MFGRSGTMAASSMLTTTITESASDSSRYRDSTAALTSASVIDSTGRSGSIRAISASERRVRSTCFQSAFLPMRLRSCTSLPVSSPATVTWSWVELVPTPSTGNSLIGVRMPERLPSIPMDSIVSRTPSATVPMSSPTIQASARIASTRRIASSASTG